MYDDDEDGHKLETHGAGEKLNDELHRAALAERVPELWGHHTGNNKVGQGQKLIKLEET